MKYNVLEAVIRTISPRAALSRAQARLALGVIDEHEKRRFDGASKAARMSEWKRPGTSADGAILGNLALLRNGSRDLTRNNPWSEKALTVIQSNTVGTGINGQIVGRNETQRKKLQDLWRDWTESTDIDADGMLDLVGIENLIIRTIAESGEVLIRRRYRRTRDQLAIPIQLQILEPDYLDSGKDSIQDDGTEIRNGIEFDKRGRRVAYWLFDEHPGDNVGYNFAHKSIRVPAADVIHAFDPKRAGQSRGYPWAAPAIRKLKDFDDYEDAQLVRQKIAACFAGIIYDGNGAAGGSTGLSKEGGKEGGFDYLQPGIIETLPPGKQITFPTPPTVQNYDEYMRSILRAVAAAYGITYEALTGDYSNVNFSSGRMGWLEMGRNVTRWQHTIMRIQVLETIGRWFFGGANLMGYDNVGAYFKWVMPRREMIDPTKEVPAMMKKIRGGLTSLQRTHAEQGYDSDEILAEIAADNAKLDKLGITLDTDPRKVNSAGSLNAPEGAPDGKTPNSEDDG